jgi:hypothetical protein
MEGSETLLGSSWSFSSEEGLLSESTSQLFWSSERIFFGWGESFGVIARFSPRERVLDSVSADAAELDMRRLS